MDRPCFDCPQPGNCGYPCLEQQKQERRWPDGGCLCTGRTYFNEGLLHHEVPASQLEDVALHPYAEQELAKFREHFTIVSMPQDEKPKQERRWPEDFRGFGVVIK
jgi:hypothetical protein